MSADGAAPARLDLASQALLGEVTKKVRELGLVVWVDAEGHYSACVDRLAAQTGAPGAPFPYPVVRHRNSLVELMLALEPYANGLTCCSAVWRGTVHFPSRRLHKAFVTPCRISTISSLRLSLQRALSDSWLLTYPARMSRTEWLAFDVIPGVNQ